MKTFMRGWLAVVSCLFLTGFVAPAFAQQSSILYSAQKNAKTPSAAGQTVAPQVSSSQKMSSRADKLAVPGKPGYLGQPARQDMQGTGPQQAGQTALQQPGQAQARQIAQTQQNSGYVYRGLVASPAMRAGPGAASASVYRGLVAMPVASSRAGASSARRAAR